MSEQISVVSAARAKASVGMEIAAVAAMEPERSAIISEQGNRTFKELNDRANQISHMLRDKGYKEGDSIAILCSNRPEYIEVRFAAHRIGARLTTVNWHLADDEAAYIVDNCDAMALFADVRCAESAKYSLEISSHLKMNVAIGGSITGFEDYNSLLDTYPTTDIDSPSLGGGLCNIHQEPQAGPKVCCVNSPIQRRQRVCKRCYLRCSSLSLRVARIYP